MTPGVRQLPPSRRDKKQIVAHLDPELVEAVHKRRSRLGLTVQEIMGEAINVALGLYGRTPIMTVGRDRLVKRHKALAGVQTSDKGAPACRAGKRRLPAWFETASVESVNSFAREVGVKVEDLVDLGLRKLIPESEIASASMAVPEAA